MIVLKFKENHTPYKAGDVAGFENEDEAQVYLDAKTAVEVKQEEKKAVEAPKENKQIEAPTVKK